MRWMSWPGSQLASWDRERKAKMTGPEFYMVDTTLPISWYYLTHVFLNWTFKGKFTYFDHSGAERHHTPFWISTVVPLYPWQIHSKTSSGGTSLVVQWLRPRTPNVGGPGSIPGPGTRSHMLQLRVCMPQLKIPHVATKIPRAATKTRCSQINA